VADLVVCNDDKLGRWDDYDSLIDAIMSAIEPSTWDNTGGPGSICRGGLGTAKALIVSQTYEVHREIAGLLKKIRAVAAKHSGDGLPRHERPDPGMKHIGGFDGLAPQSATGKAAQGQGPGVEKSAVPGK
jgi:hypothetical protein